MGPRYLTFRQFDNMQGPLDGGQFTPLEKSWRCFDRPRIRVCHLLCSRLLLHGLDDRVECVEGLTHLWSGPLVHDLLEKVFGKDGVSG